MDCTIRRDNRIYARNSIGTFRSVLCSNGQYAVLQRHFLKVGFLNERDNRHLLCRQFVGLHIRVVSQAVCDNICQRNVVAARRLELHGINHCVALLRRNGDRYGRISRVEGGCYLLQ